VTEDGLAIRQANATFYEAFERLDLDAMSNLWARTVTVTCVHPGWDLIVGYEAVMQSWRMIFEGTGEVRVRAEDPVVTVGGDHGWVACRELLFTTVQGSPVENVLIASNAFVREQGTFRIAHHQAGPLLAGRPRVVRTPETVLH
jgi:ketosteroid isomerase-like protein